jgi:hypothetical protein
MRAGTTIDRTTNVSSSTPNPTRTPISARNTSGKAARTENVAARTMPALVMTQPVAPRPVSTQSRWPRLPTSSRTRVTRKML